MTKYNFSAGPACLPKDVVLSINKEAFNYKNSGMSVFEISHRSEYIMDLFQESTSRIQTLLKIPPNYKVLWLPGGASLQFSMVPLNLMKKGDKADYIETGSWSTKAINECLKVGEVNIAASSKSSNFSYIPKNFNQNNESIYTHITSNNTIYGTQYKKFPDVINKKGFLVADMSSDILSRPLDISLIGEVQKPGLYQIENTLVNPPRVVDGLQQAGGITSKSNLEDVELIRVFKEDGELIKKITSLNLTSLVEEGDQSNNIKLSHGDVLKINSTNVTMALAAKLIAHMPKCQRRVILIALSECAINLCRLRAIDW